MQQQTLCKMYKKIIEDDIGMVAKIYDNRVEFRYPGIGNLLINVSEDDPEFFHMLFPAFFELSYLGISREQLFEIVNLTNASIKNSKIIIHPVTTDPSACEITAMIESIVAAPNEIPDKALLKDVIERGLGTLTSILKFFKNAVNERRLDKTDVMKMESNYTQH